MLKKILSFLLLYLPAVPAMSQQRFVDSILLELKQPMADSSRALSMMRLAVDYEVVDTLKAFKAYGEAVKFALEKKLYYQLGRTYQNQSFFYKTTGKDDAALKSLDAAIASYKKSNHTKAKLWEANAYTDKANLLKNQNNTEQAVDYYLKGIALLEQLGLNEQLSNSYGNISNLFGDMGEETKQMEYANKAVAVAKKSGSGQNIFMSYIMLTNAYNRKKDGRQAKVFRDSLRAYFNEAENVDNIDILFSYYLVSAQAFKINNEFDSAFYFFTRCYEVSKTYNYQYGKTEAQLQMGAVALQQKKYTEAETYLLSGIREAKAINYFGMLNDGYKYLSDIYSVTGRYKQAYEYLQLHKEISDSVTNMNSKKYATELEKKYETEKKQNQITQLQSQTLVQQLSIEQKKTLNYILGASAVALLTISLLTYRDFKHKQHLQQQKINALETEKQLNATEAVLKGEEQERARLAKDLHDGLGGMLSGIKFSFNTMKGNLIMTPDNAQAFERSMDMLDSSIKEMRRVAHNMMPEALVKFGLDTALSDFCTDINKSGAINLSCQTFGLKEATIDSAVSVAVYRIVQELINNTMKHAAAKNAIIQISKNGDVLSITVEDDGKGFDTKILQAATGMGWSNIQSRVDYLKGKLDCQSEPGKGTSVHIELTV